MLCIPDILDGWQYLTTSSNLCSWHLLVWDTFPHSTFNMHVVWQYFPPQPPCQVSPYPLLPDPVALFSVLSPPRAQSSISTSTCPSLVQCLLSHYKMSSVGIGLHLAPPRIVPVVTGYAEFRMNDLHRFSRKDLQRPKQLQDKTFTFS